MARFWRSRNTTIPSLFVPLPIDYMRQKIQGLQQQKDTAEYAAANTMGPVINAINEANIDVSHRDAIIKAFKDESDKIVEMGTQLDKNNPQRTINEMTRGVLRLKKMKKEVETPGTNAFRINRNKKQFDVFVNAINKTTMSKEAKEGNKLLSLDKYRNTGQFMGANSKGQEYGVYTPPSNVDYRKELHDHMKAVAPDINYKRGNTKHGTAWWTDHKWSRKQRTYGALADVGSSQFRANKEWQYRIKAEIDGELRYRLEHDPKYTQEQYRADLEKEHYAIATGGKTPMSIKYAKKADAKKDGLAAVSGLDLSTNVGRLIASNAKELASVETSNVRTDKANPNFGLKTQHYGELIPNGGGKREKVLRYGDVTTNIQDAYKILTSENTTIPKNQYQKDQQELKRIGAEKTLLTNLESMKTLLASKGVDVKTFGNELSDMNPTAFGPIATKYKISLGDAALLMLGAKGDKAFYNPTTATTKSWMPDFGGGEFVRGSTKVYDDSKENIKNKKSFEKVVKDNLGEVPKAWFSSDIDPNFSIHKTEQVVTLLPGGTGSLATFNKAIMSFAGKGKDNIELKDENNKVVDFNDKSIQSVSLNIDGPDVSLTVSEVSKDESKKVTRRIVKLNNTGIDVRRLANKMREEASIGEAGQRSLEAADALEGSTYIGESFDEQGAAFLNVNDERELTSDESPVRIIVTLLDDTGENNIYQVSTLGLDGKYHPISKDGKVTAFTKEGVFGKYARLNRDYMNALKSNNEQK